MRLIDADAFKAEGRKLYRDAGWDLREVHYSQLDTECNIDMIPTAEAVPLEDYRSMEQTVHKLTQALAEAEPNSCEYWDSESRFCALRRPQAEPIKHGRWEKNGEVLMFGDVPVKCSQCGFKTIQDALHRLDYHYCPNCGARMDEVEE